MVAVFCGVVDWAGALGGYRALPPVDAGAPRDCARGATAPGGPVPIRSLDRTSFPLSPRADNRLSSSAPHLQGDATYLVVENDGKLANYGVNAVCTHLGCVVPWNVAENKFKCPCHGSQYDFQGKVVRGPAPLSLALAHVNVAEDDTVVFTPWTETDFRTGLEPWWH